MSSSSLIQVTSRTVANVIPVTVAETVLTSVVVSNSGPQDIALHGFVWVTTGAGTTGVTLRVRRDSLTGPVVDAGINVTGGITAGTAQAFSIDVLDQGREVSGATYVLTYQAAGAGGNATTALQELTATTR